MIYFCSDLGYFLYWIIFSLLFACSVFLMYTDFLEISVFHMKKPVGGPHHLLNTQIKQIQRYHGLDITQNILSTQVHLIEINVAVYTVKKNIITILHHSIQAEDPAKQHRVCPPDKNSWCKWQQDLVTRMLTYKRNNCLPNVFLELLHSTFKTLSETKL